MIEYSLEYIDNIPYLVPFGQAVSRFGKPVKLNETGAVMWQKLAAAISHAKTSKKDCLSDTETLMSDSITAAWNELLCDYYVAENDIDKAQIKKDSQDFLDMLRANHALDHADHSSLYNPDSIRKNICIAGINIEYTGPGAMYPDDFSAFETDAVTDSPDVALSVDGVLSRTYPLGNLVVRTRDVCIYENSDRYYLILNTFTVITECEISKSGTVKLYYQIPSPKEAGKCMRAILADIDYERARYEVFHATRLAYLLFAQQRGVFALHSASFLYAGRLWLISAPSGTGKSTHALLWKKVYGTPVINGDLNMIDVNGGVPVVKGSPWCGTSGIFDNKEYRLGGIILLSQGTDNTASQEDSRSDAILAVSNRLITPAWDAALLRTNIDAASRIVSDSLVFRLSCDMSDDAARACKEFIDTHIATSV